MISYPIDWSRPWYVLHDNPQTEKLVISAHTRDIRADGAIFGDRIIGVLSYKDLQLSKENKQRARYAKRTGNNDLLKYVYEIEISTHRPRVDK